MLPVFGILETSKMIPMLLEGKVYPDHPQKVELKETHMSWVFLTERFAYKLRKPIQYNSQDYRTLPARLKDAQLEVDLNRRLTTDLYLGIVPITFSPQEDLVVEGTAEPIEWMVKMRRLNADRMMDYLVRTRALTFKDIRSVSNQLARFYMEGPSIHLSSRQYLSKLMLEIHNSHDVLSISEFGFAADRLELLHSDLISFVHNSNRQFQQRLLQGHILDGHGDLRPEHICIEIGNRPQIFDCLQFSRNLRIADCADELSFLALECERLGDAESGSAILRYYSEFSKDNPPDELINFYKAYRALMWARLALCRIKELTSCQWGKWLERAHNYVRLAEKYTTFFQPRNL